MGSPCTPGAARSGRHTPCLDRPGVGPGSRPAGHAHAHARHCVQIPPVAGSQAGPRAHQPQPEALVGGGGLSRVQAAETARAGSRLQSPGKVMSGRVRGHALDLDGGLRGESRKVVFLGWRGACVSSGSLPLVSVRGVGGDPGTRTFLEVSGGLCPDVPQWSPGNMSRRLKSESEPHVCRLTQGYTGFRP